MIQHVVVSVIPSSTKQPTCVSFVTVVIIALSMYFFLCLYSILLYIFRVGPTPFVLFVITMRKIKKKDEEEEEEEKRVRRKGE